MRFSATLIICLISILGITSCRKTVSWEAGPKGPPKILWGIGDEIPSAEKTPIFNEAPVRMVTSWYNGPSDTTWMKNYMKGSTMSDLYGKGYAQELVVWLANEPDYAISPEFEHDVALLTKIFKGNGPNYGPLYVVLFTEFETYSRDSTYFPKLENAFVQARDTIKAVYPKAKVALGFGGYEWSWRTYRPMKTWEINAIHAGDFIAVQEIQPAENLDILISQVRNSVRQLSTYGKPIMISHFKIWQKKGEPDKLPSDAFYKFVKQTFNQQTLDSLSGEGVFAWDFMNEHYINDPGPAYKAIKSVILNHAALDPSMPKK